MYIDDYSPNARICLNLAVWINTVIKYSIRKIIINKSGIG